MNFKGIFKSRKFWVTVGAVAAAVAVNYFKVGDEYAGKLAELIVIAGAALVGGFALKDGLQGAAKK